jgi:hypothetical protein
VGALEVFLVLAIERDSPWAECYEHHQPSRHSQGLKKKVCIREHWACAHVRVEVFGFGRDSRKKTPKRKEDADCSKLQPKNWRTKKKSENKHNFHKRISTRETGKSCEFYLEEIELLVVVHVVFNIMHEEVVECEILHHQKHEKSHGRQARLESYHQQCLVVRAFTVG